MLEKVIVITMISLVSALGLMGIYILGSLVKDHFIQKQKNPFSGF